jgi:trk system potassium uptake protein TrkA
MEVLIVGGGKVGTYLAAFLLSAGHKVILIEEFKNKYEMLQKDLQGATVISGDGTDPNLLESAGIRRVQVVAAVTGEDEDNLVVTSLARFEFNVPRVIGLVNNPKNAWMYSAEMGVDVALNQADLLGTMIAEEMSMGDMVPLLKLRKGLFSLVEEKVAPHSVVNGKKLKDIVLPDQCIITAVLRKGQMIVPHGETVLQTADELLVVVHASQMKKVADLLAERQ